VKFPQPFIDEVRSAADIVTVVSDYVSLRKAGTS
jgi:DNA primase